MYVSVSYDNVSEQAFEPFFKRAYYEGDVIPKNRKGMHKWIMDNRVPLSESENIRKASNFFISILERTDIRQIASQGLAAAPLAGSIASLSPFPINVGIIRDESKGYGKNKKIEGTIKPHMPVLIVDDLMNGGNSARNSLNALKEEGFSDISLATLMWFDWGKGKARLGIDKGKLPYYYGMRISKTGSKSIPKKKPTTKSTNYSRIQQRHPHFQKR
tara:strand:+ start:358 stop:1005 length:648 start_codon:yes stop_codon:yes gene_type:complete